MLVNQLLSQQQSENITRCMCTFHFSYRRFGMIEGCFSTDIFGTFFAAHEFNFNPQPSSHLISSPWLVFAPFSSLEPCLFWPKWRAIEATLSRGFAMVEVGLVQNRGKMTSPVKMVVCIFYILSDLLWINLVKPNFLQCKVKVYYDI